MIHNIHATHTRLIITSQPNLVTTRTIYNIQTTISPNKPQWFQAGNSSEQKIAAPMVEPMPVGRADGRLLVRALSSRTTQHQTRTATLDQEHGPRRGWVWYFLFNFRMMCDFFKIFAVGMCENFLFGMSKFDCWMMLWWTETTNIMSNVKNVVYICYVNCLI